MNEEYQNLVGTVWEDVHGLGIAKKCVVLKVDPFYAGKDSRYQCEVTLENGEVSTWILHRSQIEDRFERKEEKTEMTDNKRQSLVDMVDRARAQTDQANEASDAAEAHLSECENYLYVCTGKLKAYDDAEERRLAEEREAAEPVVFDSPENVNLAIRALAEQIKKLAEHPETYVGMRTVMDYPLTHCGVELETGKLISKRNDPCTTTITIVTWPQRKKEPK
jgi:septal ring factor EnvC (AmiA/AmiB activator)